MLQPPTIIGIAGLPGSGKSRLMDELRNNGYEVFDDINISWNTNIQCVKSLIQEHKPVAISDIMFCEREWREKLENELVSTVEWTFFENDFWQCAKNCLYRFMFEGQVRPLQDEILNIFHLAQQYESGTNPKPVAVADETIPPTYG